MNKEIDDDEENSSPLANSDTSANLMSSHSPTDSSSSQDISAGSGIVGNDHAGNVNAGNDNALLPFEDLVAPTPLPSAPPLGARWLALGSTLLAGLLGGLVGYGIGDLIGGTSVWAAVGGALGAVTAAGGVGIVANLTLRAMNEWRAVSHPEESAPQG